MAAGANCAAIAAEGIAVRDLPSGAGHDGMAIIDLPTDICMLFVRCKGGIINAKDENRRTARSSSRARGAAEVLRS